MGPRVSGRGGEGGGVMGTGELWAGFVMNDAQASGLLAEDAILGYRPVATMAQEACAVYAKLQIPGFFNELTSVHAIIVSGANGNLNWSAWTNYGLVCVEDHNNHTEDIVAQDTVFVGDQLMCINLAPVFTGVRAGDNIGIQFARNLAGSTIDGNIYAIGVRLIFT